MSDQLTHIAADGRAHMVDLGDKTETLRRAVARGKIALPREVLDAIAANRTKKGDVLAVAELAGIMAAKKTPDLIPLCHPIALSGVKLTLQPIADGIEVFAEAACHGRTGVEMEVLTAAAVACLTVYDMVKSIAREAVIGPIELVEKSGGKSGDFLKKK